MIKIDESWREVLNDFTHTKEFDELSNKIKREYLTKIIYPKPNSIFNAFNLCPFDRVSVVILGQDPYHNRGQAHGLSFSVPEKVAPPPSLINIFKEIKSDIGEETPANGDLTRWAKQGVLLLNAILTVVANSPASHRNMGWENFTDYVIKTISDEKEGVVFMLWGNFAREKKHLIDTKKHLVLEAMHPSPFSADKGFFGCKHFSRANEYLLRHNKPPIKW